MRTATDTPQRTLRPQRTMNDERISVVNNKRNQFSVYSASSVVNAVWRGRIAAMGLLLGVVTAIAGCERPAIVAEGLPVPAFAGVDLEGNAVALSELRGEVVLLNIWATWCYPCRREMPALEELHRDWGDEGLRVVAISIDAASASRDVRDFVDEYGLTFDVVHDGAQNVTRAFSTIGVPETFLIGADGRLVKRWMGRIDPHSESIRGPVREALRRRT
jgi:cytochrome c biogenesis protein CcmG, thiol:disulfide interchange protein DsbE